MTPRKRYPSEAAAARAHGVDVKTLRRWLKRDGFSSRPHRPGRRKPLAIALVERVVATHKTTESAKEAAERVGVACETMRRWLREAGVPGTTGVYWLVAKADVDRVTAERRARAEESRRLARRQRRTGTIVERLVGIIATAPRPLRFEQIVKLSGLAKEGVARGLTYAKRCRFVKTIRHPSNANHRAVWVLLPPEAAAAG